MDKFEKEVLARLDAMLQVAVDIRDMVAEQAVERRTVVASEPPEETVSKIKSGSVQEQLQNMSQDWFSGATEEAGVPDLQETIAKLGKLQELLSSYKNTLNAAEQQAEETKDE